MNHRIRLSEAAFAPLEVYVLDVAHLEGPDEDEAATALEIKHAIERLPNGGAVLHLPDDEAQLWRWHAILSAGAESAHDSGDHSWEKALTATASKVLEPLRERERKNPRGRRAKAGGEVGLNKEFYPGGTFLPTTRLPKGARPSYSGGSGRVLVAPGVLEVPPPGMSAIFASISAIVQRRPDGTIQPFPPSHPVWESGMYGSYEEAAAKCEAWNAGERFFDLRPMRENKGNQSFIRRTPSRDGSKRNFRYTYDPDLATRVNVKAKVKEKLRVPHRGVIGHYEVVARLADDVVGVLHDETGHAMAISDVALRQLARDVYRPAPGTTSREDVRHRHEREDALPRSRYETLRAIEDASEIEDHDFAQADAAYHAWKTAGAKQPQAKVEGKPTKKGAKKTRGPRVKRPPKPPPWTGGQLDAFEADLKRGRHFTSLLEAFEHASRGARTWRDLEPVLRMLRDTPGFQNARFPAEVYARHAEHDIELDAQGHTIDVEQYGVTLPKNATPRDVNEAVLFASTAPAALSEEDEARAAREEEGFDEDVDDDGLGDLWT